MEMVNIDFILFLGFTDVICLMKGSLLQVTDFMPTNLEEILYGFGTVQADDVPGVAAFMRRCLALDPASRPSALQLLNDKWLEDL
jgi:serine/threonine-protein kinase SRPK3